MANIPLIMFLVFIAITLGITYWASKRSAGASDGIAEHADGQHVLHDRADGGRGRAGETAARRLCHL